MHGPDPGPAPVIRHPGRRPHDQIYDEMRAFTDRRGADTPDELWVLEHDSVYTLGMAGRAEHILDAGDIKVVHTDRGGQVTWHGPGQLIIYVLLDLRRLGIGVSALVSRLEGAVIDCVGTLGIKAHRVVGAPGVYVNGAKLAALGLRVRRGCSYHGLAVNVDCELSAFAGINPCGYAGLKTTRLADLNCALDCGQFAERLLPHVVSAVTERPQTKVGTQNQRVPSTPARVIHA
jgi:lipoyl(octanoyl) transferase